LKKYHTHRIGELQKQNNKKRTVLEDFGIRDLFFFARLSDDLRELKSPKTANDAKKRNDDEHSLKTVIRDNLASDQSRDHKADSASQTDMSEMPFSFSVVEDFGSVGFDQSSGCAVEHLIKKHTDGCQQNYLERPPGKQISEIKKQYADRGEKHKARHYMIFIPGFIGDCPDHRFDYKHDQRDCRAHQSDLGVGHAHVAALKNSYIRYVKRLHHATDENKEKHRIGKRVFFSLCDFCFGRGFLCFILQIQYTSKQLSELYTRGRAMRAPAGF
jgi:hypothetical protein